MFLNLNIKSHHCCKLFAAVVALLFLLPPTLHAQVRINPSIDNARRNMPTGGLNSGSVTSSTGGPSSGSDTTFVDTSANKGLLYVKEIPDSVLRSKVFFFNFHPYRVKINEVWNPTLDPTGVQYSDPLDAFNGNYYLGKGIIGHPHQGLFPTFASGLDLRLQPDENSVYLKTLQTLRLYQVLTPYTRLSYNNSLNKDYLVRIAHTQNIIPGWNMAADYQLICPEGVLSSSGAKNSYLDLTTNYFSPDSRLQAQAAFLWQDFAIGENGGLSDDSYFTEGLMSNFAGLPVKYSNAQSKHLYHTLFGRVTYNMVRQVETTRERETLVAQYDTLAPDSIVTSLDTLISVDTLTPLKPRVFNVGIIGFDARYSRRKRAAYLPSQTDSTLWHDAAATLFWTNDAYPDHRWRNPLKVTIGVHPRIIAATLDTTSGSHLEAHSLFNPFFHTEVALWRASLEVEGEMDNTLQQLNSAVGEADRRLQATFTLPFDTTRQSALQLTAALQSDMPSLQMLHSSNYTLAPVRAQRFEAHLFAQSDSSVFRLFDLNLRATHLENYSWYDTALAVQTGSTPFWLLQAALTLRLQMGWFHIDMQQLLQHTTDATQMPLPWWCSKNSVYADFYLFRRALRMQVGADVRYYTRFAPSGYDPYTGLFYHQETETGNYIWADVFVNLQVRRASIYAKAGHLNALWESLPQYMLLPHYPGMGFGLFWGITWHFFD